MKNTTFDSISRDDNSKTPMNNLFETIAPPASEASGKAAAENPCSP
jgi:hypothetical protein